MLEGLSDAQYDELLEYIALCGPLGPDRGDWYLRVLVGVLTGTANDRESFPMPWERKPTVRKPLTREERRAQIRASREALAEEIAHSIRAAGVS